MKKHIFSILIILYSSLSFSQTIVIDREKLDKQTIKTAALYERIKTPDKKLLQFTAQNNLSIDKPIVWLSLYHNIYQAEYNTQLKHFLQLKKNVKQDLKKNILNIGILNYQFNKIKAVALNTRNVQVVNGRMQLNNPDDIETRNVFALSPIITKKNLGKNITFRFNTQTYFSNIPSEIDYFEIDFDDGNGKRRIYPDTDLTIHYPTTGKKQIRANLRLKNGAVFSSAFSLQIRNIAMPTPDETWNNFTADISYNGSSATGEVAVFFGNGNTDFTRPVIVSDGFDPGDTRDLSEIYDIVNQQNMINNLRNLGYDLILINFNAGDDYIQRNAMLLVKVIQTINNRMQTAGTMKTANQIVVVGPSMSGLVSRYALTYMEQNSIPHNVRNWISFDSPMKGANVPLGVQHWLRFYADEANVAGAQDALQSLQGPAAKQMLTYYYTATSGHTAGHHSLYSSFYNELNNMGFPQQTRKVAISNGSGYGNGQPYSPGTQTIEYRYRSWKVDLDGDVWALPNQSDHKIFYGVYDVIGWWNYEEENTYVNNTYPYDSAPGGTRATFQELDDTDTGGYGDIIAYYPDHAFIPTISALSINNINDPYYNIDVNINNLNTDFDKLYYPNTNQPHIQITPQSYQWFEHEIVNYAPSFTSTPVTEIDEESPYSYTLTASDQNEWNTLNFEAVSLPSWLTYNAQTHTLEGTPQYSDIGTHSVSVKVSDGLDESIQTFQIQVHPKCTNAPLTEWNGNTWTNGMPGFSKRIIINGNYNTNTNGSIQACSLQVANGKDLIVEENNLVVIERDFDNNGNVIVKNNASLVQTSDKGSISGSGNFTVERSVDNLNHYYDMVFWSIPLNTSTFTFGDLLSNAWRYYSYDPSSQSWIFRYNTDVLNPGKGYVVSAPTGFSGGNINIVFQQNNAPFNNAIVTTQVSVNGNGAADDDDWNLLGNPYPSAIDFHKFVQDNPNLQGSYYLWTNCAGLNGNNHQETGYTVYSLSGATAACQNNGLTATRYIASTQGFFIEANTAGNVTFSNTQRVESNNANFASRTTTKNRLWLNMTSNSNSFKQILIDFNPNATLDIDRLYDAKTVDSGTGMDFYSQSGTEKLTIQALPELTDDDVIIQLGYQADLNENLNIHLSDFENELNNRNIYLIDTVNQTITDLKQNDYGFIASNQPDTQLQLLITRQSLSTGDKNDISQLLTYFQNEKLCIIDKDLKFNSVHIYDTSGKLIKEAKALRTNYFEMPLNHRIHFVLVKVSYQNKERTKKVLLKR